MCSSDWAAVACGVGFVDYAAEYCVDLVNLAAHHSDYFAGWAAGAGEGWPPEYLNFNFVEKIFQKICFYLHIEQCRGSPGCLRQPPVVVVARRLRLEIINFHIIT